MTITELSLLITKHLKPTVFPLSKSLTLSVVFWPLTQPKMPFQGDAPEGSDTF